MNHHQHYPTKSSEEKASPIGRFLLPLCSQELDNGFGAGEEVAPVPPDGVVRVSFGDGGWVSWGFFWSGLRGHEDIVMCQSILTRCSRDPALSSLSPQRSLS